jgi:long-chain acyl-CoA synthetase
MRDHLATLIDDFRTFPREIAVVRYQGNRRRITTYGELATLAGRFAAYLDAHQIVAGDRVLLWGENSAEWIAAFFGCMLRGVLAVPLDAAGTADFAARVAHDTNPKLAFGDIAQLEKLAAANQGPAIPAFPFEKYESELPANESSALPTLANDTPLEILFTSGTTGDPKGVVLTHGNVLASIGPVEDGARPYMKYERLVHPLRILHTLPLSHVFGQTMGLWIPPILRAELHFESRLAAPRLVDLIKTERISVLAAVPRILALLKTHLETTHEGLAEKVQASQGKKHGPLWPWWHFRKVHGEFGFKFWTFVSGGGALPPPLEHFWNGLGFLIIQGYGMTETTALITLNHPFHVAQGTIGKPLAGREVKLGPDGEVLVRGAMISNATWQDGKLRSRGEEWLATGDIAERTASGELRFLGRKSEVIVTAAGVNVHPEDIEAKIEEQPEVAAAAVVPYMTDAGPEPVAVLAFRGASDHAEEVIGRANANLADFQRVRRFFVWPEPDLPRTSTGKVKRKPVAAWLAQTHPASGAGGNGAAHSQTNGAHAPSSDWLLALIAQIAGEDPPGDGDQLRLTEDFHLDSLGRVQLSAAIEDRLGIVQSNGLLEAVETLGELRKLVAGGAAEDGAGIGAAEAPASSPVAAGSAATATDSTSAAASGTAADSRLSGVALGNGTPAGGTPVAAAPADSARVDPKPLAPTQPARLKLVYRTWPWWAPVHLIRALYTETLQNFFTWFLSNPRVVPSPHPMPPGPFLIVANHITAYDAAFMIYALPGAIRRNIAIAMSGEMLWDFRHWRNPHHIPSHLPGAEKFNIFGPIEWFLLTTLYNVFPLPRQRDFQASFIHAGRALDRGYSVMVFPEGARSIEGKMVPFRPGIGLLARQSSVPVIPMALCGLGELKVQKRGWFRSKKIEIRVGDPIAFPPEATESMITARLQQEVEKMMAECPKQS